MLLLKQQLQYLSVSMAKIAGELGISKTALAQLVNHGQWPRRDTEQLRKRITELLTSHNVDTTHSFDEVNHFNALMNRQIDLLVTYDLPSAQPGLEIAGGLKRSLWRYERFIPVISAQLADALNDPHAPIPWLCYSDYTFVRRIIESAEQRVRPRLKKVFESGLSETIREMVLRHMGMAWLPESMVAEELVNQQIIHCWPENTDLICEIPVVVWANLEDQRAVMQRCWEKLLRF